MSLRLDDLDGFRQPSGPPWFQAIGRFIQGLGEQLAPLLDVAKEYYNGLDAIAETFRRLVPLGSEGWAISTFGLLAAPEAHVKAAAQASGDLAAASVILEDGWTSVDAQKEICALVPYVYPPEKRPIALRRQELLERASRRCAEESYEEAVLLVYSQLDGIFQDKADELGEQAFARLFSRKAVKAGQDASVRQFADLVADSKTMTGAEPEFFLTVRDAMTDGVEESTLDDMPSRHGVLHGRVLGFGTRRRAGQAFAFLAASIELLIALQGEPHVTDEEGDTVPIADAPEGLQFLLSAMTFSPVRSVYLANRNGRKDLLLAVKDERSADADGSGMSQVATT